MKENLTVLIIGAGAREDTISRAWEKSSKVKRLIAAPGNDFIGYERKKEVIVDKNCSLKDPESLLRIACKYNPDRIEVAQDDALAGGTVDLLQKNGFQVFGPTKIPARIEWDKKESREFMQRHKIPSPDFRWFDSNKSPIFRLFDPNKSAKNYVKKLYKKEPDKLTYIKATGLCAGKGALKSTNLDEAIANIQKMKKFGDAGKVFLVEEGLIGEEFSYHVVVDGENYHAFKSAQDSKTVFNFDEGDQTGGMGAISPAMVTAPISEDIEKNLIKKPIDGMRKEGRPYKGVLYLSGIKVDGKPFNIEYNARWGDPECQVVLPSVKTDYVDIIEACLEGRLDRIEIQEDKKSRFCIVGASRGYPNNYENVIGKRIYGLEDAMKIDGVEVYGAGIKIIDGKFYANGGRLFSIVGEGDNIMDARQKACFAMAHVHIKGNNLQHKIDIGWRDVERFLE